MKAGIVSSSVIAREGRFDPAHFLGREQETGEEAEAKEAEAKETADFARRYGNPYAMAEESMKAVDEVVQDVEDAGVGKGDVKPLA